MVLTAQYACMVDILVFGTTLGEHNLLLKIEFIKVVSSGITTRPNAKLVKHLFIPVAMSIIVQVSVPIL